MATNDEVLRRLGFMPEVERDVYVLRIAGIVEISGLEMAQNAGGMEDLIIAKLDNLNDSLDQLISDKIAEV